MLDERNMIEMATLVITMTTLGQIGLVVSILIARAGITEAYWPLAAFFFALSCLLLQPLTHVFFPEFEVFSVVLMLPALLSLAPLLWIYVEAMTSKVRWTLQLTKGKHFWLFMAGVCASTLTALLPSQTLKVLLTTGDMQMSSYVEFLMMVVFALVLSWIVQSIYYFVLIINRLKIYHLILKQNFANNESRQLYWLYSFVLLLMGIWFVGATAVLIDNLFAVKVVSALGAAMMAMTLVWSLSFFGLLQRPGFEGEYVEGESAETELGDTDEKYQRSALDQSHSKRIAQKLDALMETQKVYLDANISLTKLSSMTGISPNYLSQTLNETLGQSFFDYINGWRIQRSKVLLIESKMSVLEVALEVGFNARSSFYKAFKQITQKTPSEYRQARESVEQ